MRFQSKNATASGSRSRIRSWRETIVDWDDSVSRMVAEYRAGMAEHIDDPAWQTMVDRLHGASPEFAAFWERHDVLGVYSRFETAAPSPRSLGSSSFVYTNLWVGQQVGIRIVAFTPSNERTRRRLETLYDSLDDAGVGFAR